MREKIAHIKCIKVMFPPDFYFILHISQFLHNLFTPSPLNKVAEVKSGYRQNSLNKVFHCILWFEANKSRSIPMATNRLEGN